MNQQLQAYYLDAMGIERWVTRQAMHSEKKSDLTNEWQVLQEKVKNCHLCALCKTRTQTVFGVGNFQADLMIVGEAPGFHEDQQGEPFVGRAGQLLNKMLSVIGLNREMVFIANVLKCRPPNNRDPLPEEIKQCTAYLEQQVKLISPKLIVALGRYAAHYLLETTTSLSQLRKNVHSFGKEETPLIVSYHPAYLLRNPADKRKAYEDWCRISKHL